MEQTNTEKNYVHFGHLGAVVFCALILIAITFMKNGFQLSLTGSDNKQKAVYTYEQAKAEVLAKSEPVPPLNDDIQKQLAIIDPSLNEGAVLGASTESDLQFPPAEEIFSKETLDQINIRLLKETNFENIKVYVQQAALVELNFEAAGILNDINSNDQEVLKKAPEKVKALIAALAQIDVPDELKEYHKLKMIYYQVLGNLANNFASAEIGNDFELNSTMLFSIMERMERISSVIYNKYGMNI